MGKADLKVTDLIDLKIGDFIRYEFRDELGLCTYTGEITKVNLKTRLIEILTFIGTIGLLTDDDTELYHVKTKPKGWAKFKKKSTPKKKKLPKSTTIKTQSEQITDLIKNNPTKKLPALLKQAKKEIAGNPQLIESQITLAMVRLNR